MIPISEPCFTDREREYILDCINTNWISSLGKYVTKFSDMFAQFCGTAYALPTCNGTAALHLALLSLDIGEGDEVIVPDLTFVASANPVLYCGAKPVLVDVDKQTWNIDPARIEECITERTKALIIVHLYGHPCDMDAVTKIARKYNLKVVEDAAQAHGAEYKGKRVGSFGDIGVFSFYGNKIITTGEGGMITTNSKELIEKMHFLHNHGKSKTRHYWHDMLGYNYRMTNIQAAIGVAQMEKLEEFIEIKRKNAALYNSFLSKVDGITRPVEAKGCKNIYWMYSVLIEDDFGVSRNDVMMQLKEKGIETRPFFSPLHQMPMYRSDRVYPITEELSRKGINLPSALTLTESNIRTVCDALVSIRRKL